MARIVFIAFPETGHLFASFKLAKALKAAGQEITYIGIRDFEEPIRRQGIDFQPIFERSVDRGFFRQQVANRQVETFDAIVLAAREGRESFDLLSEVVQAVRHTRPDLLIIDLLLSDVALMAKRLGIPLVLLNTMFYDPWEDARKTAAYRALEHVPELLLCPEEFDFPQTSKRRNRYYVEASIDLERRDVSFPWQRLSSAKPLIYFSLGSQGHLISGGRQLMQRVIEAISAQNDWQLVLTTGIHIRPKEFGELPDNVIVVNEVPQLELLKRASIVITHGGLNTVKECLYYGVPMIVFPFIRDQPGVAARVVHHGVGVRGNIHDVSVETVHSLINEIDRNPLLRMRCERMAERFKVREQAGEAVRIVLSIVSPSAQSDHRPALDILQKGRVTS